MRTTIIVQARMGSDRLPGKVMNPLAGIPMIEHVMRNLFHAHQAGHVVLATTDRPQDTPLVDLAQDKGWLYLRGSEENLLERFLDALALCPGELVIRVTADCPLIDPKLIDRLIRFHADGHYDYSCMRHAASDLPRGLGAEAIQADVLKDVYQEPDLVDRHYEHVTLYIKEHPEKYRIGHLPNLQQLERPGYRVTVDTPEDYELVSRIYDELYDGAPISSESVMALLDKRPDLLIINEMVRQKPG